MMMVTLDEADAIFKFMEWLTTSRKVGLFTRAEGSILLEPVLNYEDMVEEYIAKAAVPYAAHIRKLCVCETNRKT